MNVATHRWQVVRLDDGVHVIPIGDVVEHEPKDCACGPAVQFGDDEGSFEIPLYSHHSADGRERYEVE